MNFIFDLNLFQKYFLKCFVNIWFICELYVVVAPLKRALKCNETYIYVQSEGCGTTVTV